MASDPPVPAEIQKPRKGLVRICVEVPKNQAEMVEDAFRSMAFRLQEYLIVERVKKEMAMER